MLPKLVLTDIDGVWTDGGMYYDQEGNEWKKFNTSDNAGVLFLKKLKIPVGIVTGENTHIVERRAARLNIDYVFQGVHDKLSVMKTLCTQLHIMPDEVAYIGDDISDIELLQNVGLSAAPANAPAYVKDVVDYVIDRAGGDGAFRRFVEYILESNGIAEYWKQT